MPLRLTPIAAAGLSLLALPASAGAAAVGVRVPATEGPGGTVPAVVTAYDVPVGADVRISALGTRGAGARCRGAVWVNPLRRTASRRCYLQLPGRAGAYRLVARVRVDGGATQMARKLVRAVGPRSSARTSIARAEAIERCFNATDRVWLTFDDGGSEAQVRAILSTLARNGVRGRFFFTGAWAQEHPGLLAEIERAGHLLGNHSFSHPPLGRASAAEVLREIDEGVRSTTSPMLLRPPSGSGAFTGRLASLAASRGYRLCRWTVNTGDHRGASVEQIVERIRVGDEITPPLGAGGNVLLHAFADHTAPGLQEIIDAIRAEGLTLDALTG